MQEVLEDGVLSAKTLPVCEVTFSIGSLHELYNMERRKCFFLIGLRMG